MLWREGPQAAAHASTPDAPREAQIKGYFHRHGFKILVSGRFVPGFRTAAYLTAGILKLPPLKLLATDLVAATMTTLLMFGLGFLFANQIQTGIHEVQQWIAVVVAVGVGSWLLYRFYRVRERSGLPVGPPVLEVDEVPLPSRDEQTGPIGEAASRSRRPSPRRPIRPFPGKTVRTPLRLSSPPSASRPASVRPQPERPDR